MRAWFQALAVSSLLILAGCVTLPGREAVPEAPLALSGADERLADALASYSLALISEATLGAYQDALAYVRAASESDPGNLTLALKVAAGHLARKEYEAAERVVRRALVYHPRSREAHFILGITCQVLQKNRCAERAFREVIRLEPRRADGYIRLASLWLAGNRHSRVLRLLDRGFSLVGEPGPLLGFCDDAGRLYLAGGQAERAIPFFQRAVRHGPPMNMAAREMLARAQAVAGRNEEAIEGFLEVSRAQPTNAQVALILGEIYERQGEPGKAAEQYKRVIQAEPGDAAAVLRLAHLSLNRTPDQALGPMEEAVRRKPDDLALRVYLGLLYMRLDRPADAVAQYAQVEEKVLALGGGDDLLPQFFFWYGSACERAGRWEDAERLMTRCIEKKPDSAQALNYLAYMWAEKGVKLDQALDHVERALKLMPGEGAYLDTLGWIHYRKGNYAAALKYLRKAARALPDDPVILDHLGDAWHATGRQERARAAWDRSLELEKEESGTK